MKKKHRQLARVSQPNMQASSGGNVGGAQAYDAASNSPTRSSLTAFPTNSRSETRGYTRKELVKASRGLESNVPFVRSIKRTIGRQSVGKGIFPRPATEDKEWNKKARQLFNEWAGNPGVYSIDGSRDFFEDQRLVAETCYGDGEYFAAFVKSENGAPMIQPFDTFEIDSSYASGADGWDDGVLPNPFGRIIRYGVRELPTTSQGYQAQGNMREVDAVNMIHVMRRHRAKMNRGLPWAFSGGTNAIHLMDLYALLVGEAKLHSLLTVQVNRTARARGKGAFNAIEKSDATDRDDLGGLEKALGPGQVNYVGQDGEIKLHSSDRPSPNIVEFTKELKRSYASASELPLEVIEYMGDTGGAPTRAVLDMAQAFFDDVQDMVIWRHSQRIYVWRIANAMNRGELPRCKDPLWWTCAWQGPRKLTADPSRTAQSDIKLVKNGMKSITRYYSELALDADEEIDDQIEFLKRTREKCEAVDLPFELVIESTPGANAAPPAGSKPTDPNAPADPNNPNAAQTIDGLSQVEEVKVQLDAYGVGVRAGVITPSLSDEESFRERAGLPPMSSAVRAAWDKDGGTRRPITLTPQPGSEPAPAKQPPQEDES